MARNRRGGPYRGDPYTRRAREQGYAARSVFKLDEIDRRFRLVRRGARVLDLGCAPGSWSRYLAGRGARVVGVDLQAVEPFPGTFLHGDIEDLPAEALREALGGPADLVVSDMAPATTGARAADHFRQVELARLALGRAAELLVPGGAFVVKVFDGADAPAFVAEVRARFDAVRRVRPKAVRKVSREFFVVATGFRREG